MSLAIGLAILLVSPALGESPDRPDGAAMPAIERLAAAEALDGLGLGASVRCTADGSSWGGRDQDLRMNPASGAKLLATAAALRELGPERTFATRILGRREADLARDVVIVSEADPSLRMEDLTRLAKAVAATGVARIEGPMVLDVSHFAGSTTPPAYDTKVSDASYRPEVPAFAVEFGAVYVKVSPGRRVGAPVRVTTSLIAPSLVVDNSATTSAGKRIDKLVIEARAAPGGKTRLVIGGELGRDAKPQGTRKRLADPARIGGELLIRALRKEGVEVSGALELRTDPPGDEHEERVELAALTSDPLATDVAETNTTSNNFMAETIFKHLGVAGEPASPSGPATWERAAERTTRALDALGLDPGGFEIINGSGLYDGTKVSAATMTRLLTIERGDDAAARAFFESLAVAGESGTLRRRLKTLAGKVRGKTGTLDNALSLSGYVPSERCLLAFSVMINGDLGKRATAAKRQIDRFVLELSRL